MRGRAVILFVLLMAFFVAPAFAQDQTATPDPQQQGQQGQQPTQQAQQGQDAAGTQQQVTTVQLGHFVSDAGTLVVYVNGQPSAIQNLTFPSMTGWVEIPGSSATLSFIPQGGAQSMAIGSPITLNAGGFQTIVLVGSSANGTVQAISINQNMGTLAPGCARVTIFHAIEGGPGVDIAMDDGTILGSNVAFPGAMAGGQQGTTGQTGQQGQQGQQGGMTNNCNQGMMTTDQQAGQTAGAEATQEAGQTGGQTEGAQETQEAGQTGGQQGATGQMGMTGMTGAVDCTSVPIDMAALQTAIDAAGGQAAGAEATQEAGQTGQTGGQTTGAEATQETGQTGGQGTTGQTGQQGGMNQTAQTFANCAFTFDVPAGTFNFQVLPTGTTGNALANLANTQLNADTHYFIAVVGTADAPQVFTFSTSAAAIGALQNAQQNQGATGQTGQTGDQSGQQGGAEATPEATQGT